MKPKYIFTSPGKNRIIKIHAVFFIVLTIQSLYLFESVTQYPCRIFRGFSFKNIVMTCARCGKLCIMCFCNISTKPLQTRYDMTYIYDRYYIGTHVYMFLFSVKKRVFELSRVWPWRWPREGTPYMVFIGPVFHYTIKTYLRRVWHCGYEWVEKEMCRFA